TSPRSSHLNRLFAGYFLHSLIASCSPGSVGSTGVGDALVGGGAGGGGAGGVTVGGMLGPRVPVGGEILRPGFCAWASALDHTRKATVTRFVTFMLIESCSPT